MKKLCSLFAVALVLLLSAGCSSKISVEEAKAKIEELAAKGVPEEDMQDVRMYLYQMETSKKSGNTGTFRNYQDSLHSALGSFETRMTKLLEESGPVIDSLKKVCEEKKTKLTGLHLKEAEPNVAKIDSLLNANQLLMARARLEKFNLDLDTLIMEQKTADSLREHFVGAWVMEKESEDKRYNVVERTEIHMRPDSTLYIMEKKKGKTSDNTIEDWEFRSTGTWDIKGDVAYHYINKEKCVRHHFHSRNPETGKWKKQSKEPYDSTITNGSKDRYAVYADLDKDFKKFPIRR
ncbi:MAG: hypothetical protein ACLFVQ_06045 [Chitinispirillaceae bacterium]